MSSKKSILKKTVIFATKNIHKFNEAKIILDNYNLSIAMLRIKSDEIQDDDIANIAKSNALETASETNLPLIVEDSGLFIDKLNGFPGPYSSYIFKTIGNRGILKLLKNYNMRKANFQSAIAFCYPEKTSYILKHFIGNIEGKITTEIKGNRGFGFDPIFEPIYTKGKTFGEMSIHEKIFISHRSNALQKFLKWYLSFQK